MKKQIVIGCMLIGINGLSTVDSQEPLLTTEITLDLIMTDPEWLGRQPESAYWADDGRSVLYRRKKAGSRQYTWFRSDLHGNIQQVLPPTVLPGDVERGSINAKRTQKAYVRHGDLYVKNLKSGAIRQLTRTSVAESGPAFMTDGKRIAFTRNGKLLVRHLKSGLEQQLVELIAEDEPDDERSKQRKGFLPEQQNRLFDILSKQRKDADTRREAEKTSRQNDPTRSPNPWYLGADRRISSIKISPSGNWCLVVLSTKKTDRGLNDKMPVFLDESGYVQMRDVRPLVGTGKSDSDEIVLLDLVRRTRHDLALDHLPNILSNPLAELLDSTQSKGTVKSSGGKSTKTADDPTPRPVRVGAAQWTSDGNRLAISLFSQDNKDRWIAIFDCNSKERVLATAMHRHDPAWINRRVGRMAWLPDNRTFYYTDESNGYSQLYTFDAVAQKTRQLTSGNFVVSSVQPNPDGSFLYFKANRHHPGIYEIFRVDVVSGDVEQLTHFGGVNDGIVSPDEKNLLVTHSSAGSPPELWIVPMSDLGKARQITNTVSRQFQQIPWIQPKFVTLPSRAGRPIHARLYLPDGPNTKIRPAVIFIHGAGYLQNAHQGWSHYYREFMFHSLLAKRGFVVLDMDYRGSAGYGRDWRTSIYRNMGGPELEDLLDGKKWLVDHHNVDANRIGLYGGSYGGFLTLMALFQHPGQFACGAALRPVTDWAHYNHGYTSNILNTPQVDPEAYRRSSPIEFAAGLEDPLLICHGMVDDNVFFKDTARLAQRLIELKKEDWEVAIYPIEPHGFVEPTSWRDEYRRILTLFNRHLRK
jgi:dipeptidyl aminopeptidase/acylaminoacyl peptidase